MQPTSADPSTSHRLELWWQFTVRAVEMRHRGSYLGIVWSVVTPLLMLGLYVTVFGFILESKLGAVPNESRVDFALAVFAGLIVFHLFGETLAAAPTYITANPNLVKKVVFPLDVLPAANVGALWFHAGISFFLLLVATAIFGRFPSLSHLLWTIPILIPHALLCLGVGWIVSALGVFFRDISQITGFVTQILLYASAVFFSIRSIQEIPALWTILRWNPILHTIDLIRGALLWELPISLSALAYTWACGLTAFLLGRWLFRKTQPGFADVL